MPQSQGSAILGLRLFIYTLIHNKTMSYSAIRPEGFLTGGILAQHEFLAETGT